MMSNDGSQLAVAGPTGLRDFLLDDQTASPLEQAQRNRRSHRPVTGRRGMQVVATIVGGQQAIRMFGIADNPVEIDNLIEVPRGTNPAVDCYAVGLVC